jgi:magnesium transporter
MAEIEDEAIIELVESALDAGNLNVVRDLLHDRPPPEAAALISDLPHVEHRVQAFRLIDSTAIADVFAYLPVEQQHRLVIELSDGELRPVLAQLSVDDRTSFFEELPEEIAQRMFNLLEPGDLKRTKDQLAFPDDSVGRLMSPNYLSAMADWTIARALEHFRTYGQDTETADMVYVIDRRGRLIDDVPLRRFIMAPPTGRVRDVMDGSFVSLRTTDDQERAVALMMDYDLVALPITDDQEHLVGIVTIDDVFDVAEEETTEDIHKASAIDPLRMSYTRASVYMLFQRRIYWLAVLVVVNLASSGVIAAYEDALAAAVTLAFFIPLLIDSGGNSGSQAATMMIRAMVTGEVEPRDWLKTLAKELGVGLLLGLALAVLASGLGFYRGGAEIGLVVGLSMIVIIIFSNLVGTILPFILNLLKFDPAAASSPLITSICDTVGLLIYFIIAVRVLGLT